MSSSTNNSGGFAIKLAPLKQQQPSQSQSQSHQQSQQHSEHVSASSDQGAASSLATTIITTTTTSRPPLGSLANATVRRPYGSVTKKATALSSSSSLLLSSSPSWDHHNNHNNHNNTETTAHSFASSSASPSMTMTMVNSSPSFMLPSLHTSSSSKWSSSIKRNNNNSNSNNNSVGLQPLLRFGERLEDLFGIQPSTDWNDTYYTKCRQLVALEEETQDDRNTASLSSNNNNNNNMDLRLQLWWEILQQARTSTTTTLSGTSLLRLHRRATSRLPWQHQKEDTPTDSPSESSSAAAAAASSSKLLDIWLQYVRIQMELGSLSDAQLTLRHLRTSGGQESLQYQQVAQDLVDAKRMQKQQEQQQEQQQQQQQPQEPSSLSSSLLKRNDCNDPKATTQRSSKRCKIDVAAATTAADCLSDSGVPDNTTDHLPTSAALATTTTATITETANLDDSNMSLDDDDDDDDDDNVNSNNHDGIEDENGDSSDTIKWKTTDRKTTNDDATRGGAIASISNEAAGTETAVSSTDVMATPSISVQRRKPFSEAVGKHSASSSLYTSSAASFSANKNAGTRHKTSRGITLLSKLPNNSGTASLNSRRATRQRTKLLISGKPQRVDSSQSMMMWDEEEDEDLDAQKQEDTHNNNPRNQSMDENSLQTNQSHASSAAKSTVTSATSGEKDNSQQKSSSTSLSKKFDLSYIFEWDPNKRFEKPTTTPTTTSSSPSKKKAQPATKYNNEKSDMQAILEQNDSSNEASVAAMAKKSTRHEHDKERDPVTKKGSDVFSSDANTSSVVEQVPSLESRTASQVPPVLVSSDNTKPGSKPPSSLSSANEDFLPLVNEKNMLRVNGVPYAKLGVVGKGGSCKVYRALSKDCSIVGIKKVKTAGMDRKTLESYANEINLLKSLRGNPAIIQMYDSQVDLEQKAIFVVMELGEVDLNHVLQQQMLLTDSSVEGRRRLNMNFVRLTWFQMLSAVHCIHEARIIHGDLKPANFLFVRGALKLIDFGIAKAIQSEDTTNIYRENQIGTLNYMSPEAILDSGCDSSKPKMKLGRASDIWSLGCILYQMVYGKTPFYELQMIQKLQAIINPNHCINFPDDVEEAAIDAMRACLQRKPEDRLPIVGDGGLLNEHVFLHPRRQNSNSNSCNSGMIKK